MGVAGLYRPTLLQYASGMNNINRVLLLLFCLGLSTLSAPGAAISAEASGQEASGQDAPLPPDGADVALCYRGEVGYMLAPPPGWLNLRDAAESFGTCVIYVPEGYDFDSAPAVIYPNVVGVGAGADPVKAEVERMRAKLSAAPDGDKLQVVAGEPFKSAFGVEFQLYYFNNGPSPNNFELVAYNVQGEAMLMTVLSAMTDQERRVYLGDFMKLLDGIFTMQVSDKTSREKSAAQ